MFDISELRIDLVLKISLLPKVNDAIWRNKRIVVKKHALHDSENFYIIEDPGSFDMRVNLDELFYQQSLMLVT